MPACRFEQARRGPLRVWRQPEKDKAYVIGVDTAEGVFGGDSSVACVLSVDPLAQVAEWADISEPYEFAQQIVWLAEYYNQAVLAIEVNNHGLTVINRVRDLGYGNLYTRRQFDQVQRKWVNRLGWRTDTSTRPVMIDKFRNAISEGSLIINSYDLVQEMRTFVFNDSGKAEAMPGEHDDRVMACGVGLMAHEFALQLEPQKDDKYLGYEEWIWDQARKIDDDWEERKAEEEYLLGQP